MKKLFTLVGLILISTVSFAQKNEQTSKMSEFVSKTGTIIKFEDYKIPSFKTNYSPIECKIRKGIAANNEVYFLHISKKGKYSNKSTSIAYEDLLEIIKALNSLKDSSLKDISTSSDYLESKFITEDGFQIGYFINKGKISWYMALDKYGNDSTIFLKEFQNALETFQLGKDKIETLKLN